MAQWLEIHLAVQGTQVDPLVWEDSRAAGRLCPCNPTARSPCTLEPVLPNKRSHPQEKPTHTLEKRPHAAVKTQAA